MTAAFHLLKKVWIMTSSSSEAERRQPKGQLEIRTVAMPADSNNNGDIFGGWVLSQMDIAGGIASSRRCRGRCATVAIDAMTFHLPVKIGDVLCCYTEVVKVGNTSITVKIEAWTQPSIEQGLGRQLVTEGTFVFVAIDDDRRPRKVPDL